MTGGFVALAFSFCAGMVNHEGQDLLAMGYVSDGECVVRMMVGGPIGDSDTNVINGHDVTITILDGGAIVEIDTQKFVIQKSEGI